jgi:hypothetical protein
VPPYSHRLRRTMAMEIDGLADVIDNALLAHREDRAEYVDTGVRDLFVDLSLDGARRMAAAVSSLPLPPDRSLFDQGVTPDLACPNDEWRAALAHVISELRDIVSEHVAQFHLPDDGMVRVVRRSQARRYRVEPWVFSYDDLKNPKACARSDLFQVGDPSKGPRRGGAYTVNRAIDRVDAELPAKQFDMRLEVLQTEDGRFSGFVRADLA